MRSPQLKVLIAALEAGDIGALAALWDHIEGEGTPLIEPVDEKHDHFWLTFLWRETSQLRSVHVLKGIAGWGFHDTQLTKLQGTDLWYKTHQVRDGARFGYYYVLDMDYSAWDRGITTNQWPKFEVDPLCRHPFPTAERAFIALAELPGAPDQPWTRDQPGVPKGEVTLHLFKSEVLGNERKVWIYTPPGYSIQKEPYGLVILFDGGLYVSPVFLATPEVLDNLLEAGRIPPMIAVFVGNVNREQDLPCNERFVSYVAEELVPWVHRSYHVSADPSKCIVGGSSYGGLAAAYCGLRRPDLFGNVLSQSGSYWWYPECQRGEADVEPGWLIRRYRDTDRMSLRFYLDVGVLERSPDPRYPDQVAVNRHMRDVLLSKGYPVRYAEYNGGHDYACWAGTLPDGLVYLAAPGPRG